MPSQHIIDEITRLLGNPVLLPIKEGQKGCKIPGWPGVTLQESLMPPWQSKLRQAGNLGVLLGPNGGNLASLDCDSEEALTEMLKLNPALVGSLRSAGARGGNIWCVMEGPYPQRTIAVNGFGEFRSGGGQTVIYGKHPSGVDYRRIVSGPPVSLRYDSIIWPDRVAEHFTLSNHLNQGHPGGQPRRKKGEEGGEFSCISGPELLSLCDSGALNHCATAPLGNKAKVALKQMQHEESFTRHFPVLSGIVQSRIDSQLPLVEGSRNLVLTTQIVPRLFNAVSLEQMMVVLGYLIRSDQVGGYPPAEAAAKAAHVYRAMEAAYICELPADEREMYECMSRQQRFIFRLCRSLASDTSNPDFPPPMFFLSSGNLAERYGEKNKIVAWRALKKFTSWNLMTCLQRGTRRRPGVLGKSAEFRWEFSTEAREEPDTLPTDDSSGC